MTKLDYQSEGTLKTITMEKDKISLVKHKLIPPVKKTHKIEKTK